MGLGDECRFLQASRRRGLGNHGDVAGDGVIGRSAASRPARGLDSAGLDERRRRARPDQRAGRERGGRRAGERADDDAGDAPGTRPRAGAEPDGSVEPGRGRHHLQPADQFAEHPRPRRRPGADDDRRHPPALPGRHADQPRRPERLRLRFAFHARPAARRQRREHARQRCARRRARGTHARSGGPAAQRPFLRRARQDRLRQHR